MLEASRSPSKMALTSSAVFPWSSRDTALRMDRARGEGDPMVIHHQNPAVVVLGQGLGGFAGTAEAGGHGKMRHPVIGLQSSRSHREVIVSGDGWEVLTFAPAFSRWKKVSWVGFPPPDRFRRR